MKYGGKEMERSEAMMPEWGIRNLPRYATGLSAMALCVLALRQGGDLPLLLASTFLLLICATDTFLAQIPNPLNAGLVLASILYHGYTSGLAGVATSLLGLLLGLSLLLIPYLLGGMGAGDVKALAALGALLGPAPIFIVFLYTGLIGGIMAVLHYLCNHDLRQKCRQGLAALRVCLYTKSIHALKPERKGETLRFPYAAAFTFGYFAFLHWGGPS